MITITLQMSNGTEVKATHNLEGSPMYVYAAFSGADSTRVFAREPINDYNSQLYIELPAFEVKVSPQPNAGEQP